MLEIRMGTYRLNLAKFMCQVCRLVQLAYKPTCGLVQLAYKPAYGLLQSAIEMFGVDLCQKYRFSEVAHMLWDFSVLSLF